MTDLIVVANQWTGGTLVMAQVPPPTEESIWSVIFSGGILGVAIMSALIALSLVTVYLIVDQSLALRRQDIAPPEFIENVRLLLSQTKLKEADQFCRDQPSPVAFIIASGIAEVEFGWPAVEKALEDSTAQQAARLYRKIEYLAVLGNLAPMLGLLGTVSGMIVAFRQVALSQGAAGAGELAQGIYSALVTTVAGLIIAIPALAAFAILRNRIDQLVVESAYAAQHAFAPIRRRIPGATAPRVAVAPPVNRPKE